jgi:hypothetical protein
MPKSTMTAWRNLVEPLLIASILGLIYRLSVYIHYETIYFCLWPTPSDRGPHPCRSVVFRPAIPAESRASRKLARSPALGSWKSLLDRRRSQMLQIRRNPNRPAPVSHVTFSRLIATSGNTMTCRAQVVVEEDRSWKLARLANLKGLSIGVRRIKAADSLPCVHLVPTVRRDRHAPTHPWRLAFAQHGCHKAAGIHHR